MDIWRRRREVKMKKGFTLIELLIVIAVLGILAAGILATIDPFEQFKKARDSNARNAVVEVYNAYVRYNANHGNWPWSVGGACTGSPTGALLSTYSACTDELVQDGELKAGFSSALQGANSITTATLSYVSAPSENMIVCFQPESKSLKKDSGTRYNAIGVTTTGCYTNTSSCYWCAM